MDFGKWIDQLMGRKDGGRGGVEGRRRTGIGTGKEDGDAKVRGTSGHNINYT